MEYVSYDGVELAFLNANRQLLYGSEYECRLGDIETGSCLFTFDVTKTDPPSILQNPWFCGKEDILEFMSNRDEDIRNIVRVSANITIETIAVNCLAVFNAVGGQPTFLEVRDDTLWELDQSTERPLCWLPISWRKAFDRDLMLWSGSFLIFGLPQGDIGILNMDSLRRACTSVRRQRAAKGGYARF